MAITNDGVRHSHVGDYVLLKKIGQHVFLGEHTMSGERVAVKIIHTKRLSDKYKDMEVDCVRAVGAHPAVVAVRAVISDVDDHHFIVMELGQCDLASLINISGGPTSTSTSAPPLGLAAAWTCARQMLSGIAHVHGRRIVHNDIKLTNCIMTTAGFVQLIDFGLSEPIAATPAGDKAGFLGTLAYMAPEILASRTHNTAADIWAFGVCLFVLLTGAFPFQHRNLGELLLGQTRRTFDDPAHGLDPATMALFRQLFADDPAQRPTAAQLLATPFFCRDDGVAAAAGGHAGPRRLQRKTLRRAGLRGLQPNPAAAAAEPGSPAGSVRGMPALAALTAHQRAELGRMDGALNRARAQYLADRTRTKDEMRKNIKRLSNEQQLVDLEARFLHENPQLKPSDFQELRLSVRQLSKLHQHGRRLGHGVSASDLQQAARDWGEGVRPAARHSHSAAPSPHAAAAGIAGGGRCQLGREIDGLRDGIRTLRGHVRAAITGVDADKARRRAAAAADEGLVALPVIKSPRARRRQKRGKKQPRLPLLSPPESPPLRRRADGELPYAFAPPSAWC